MGPFIPVQLSLLPILAQVGGGSPDSFVPARGCQVTKTAAG